MSFSSEQRGELYLEHLSHLVAHRALDELLADALATLIHIHGASGGSLCYRSTLMACVDQGELTRAARHQIAQIEETHRVRADHGGRQIQLPRSLPISQHRLPDRGGTIWSVPLTSHDRICGTVALVFPLEHGLDHQQSREVSLLAHTIGMIAANVEQVSVTRQRLSQLGLFYQMGQAITSTFDTARLFEDTIDLALSVVDAQCASLLLLDPTSGRLRVEVTRGNDSLPRSRYVAFDQGIAGWVASHGTPALVDDVSADERFDPLVDGVLGTTIRTLISVPMQIKSRVIGILQVYNKAVPDTFNQEDLSVLITLASQVTIALENATLYSSLSEERDRIIAARESTRRELARDLHDGPVQILSAIAMQIDHLERLIQQQPDDVPQELESLRTLLQHAMRDARMLLFELRPVMLETQGLIPTLECYVERLSESHSFKSHFDPGNTRTELSTSVAHTVFAIVQEAINNVEKHASADNVWIRMQEADGQLIVSVEDDGSGFDVDAIIDRYDELNSFGLLSMQERAELIDGLLTLESGTRQGNRGTIIRLRVALPKSKEASDDGSDGLRDIL